MSSKIANIYGVSHSPWLQAACLTGHYADYDIRLHSIPSLQSLLHSGFIIPVLLNPLIGDSFAIIRYLSPSLFENEIDHQSVRKDTTNLFYYIGTSRINSFRKFFFEFLPAWSKMYEKHDSTLMTALNFCFRPLLALYMWVFIAFGTIMLALKRGRPLKQKAIDVLNKLEQELDTYMYGSDVMTFADILIFGQMQCLYSGLTDDLLPMLHPFPKIQAWIRRMNEHFSTYPMLYSRRIDERGYSPDCQNIIMECCFWASFLVLIHPMFLKYTLVVIVFFMVYRNLISTSVEKMVNKR